VSADNEQAGLRIITSGAFAAALETLLDVYRAQYPGDIELSFGSSLGAAHDSIPTRLGNGERFDLYFLARDAIDEFTSQGFIRAGSGVDLVESHIGAMVRSEEPAPDISTVEAFRETLLSAKSVAHAASASGIYLSTEVFPALGIVEEMKKTARTILSERVGTVVARGDADLGFQQISEILPIKGVKMIGRLPGPYGRSFRFCMGIGAETDKLEACKDLMRFVASEKVASVIRETGLEPLFPTIE
jgi:molybdate transport system substrate-binding protein